MREDPVQELSRVDLEGLLTSRLQKISNQVILSYPATNFLGIVRSCLYNKKYFSNECLKIWDFFPLLKFPEYIFKSI